MKDRHGTIAQVTGETKEGGMICRLWKEWHLACALPTSFSERAPVGLVGYIVATVFALQAGLGAGGFSGSFTSCSGPPQPCP